MEQRQAFVWEAQQEWWSMTELCARYAISRKTGYKWLARARAAGGLCEHSRRPHSCPHAVAPALVERIVRLRRAHRRWGPKKLRRVLTERWPTDAWPARSTISLLLKRHGLAAPRARRRRPGRTPGTLSPMDAPNAVWAIDFKGHFRTGDGAWCYPLTITDGFSRYLLACDGLPRPTRAATRQTLERVFREYGLPTVIRSDNGVPFAGPGLARLSRLAVWWIHLGIRPELIAPGAPQQNGRHERMHRTLKAETAMPAAPTLTAQRRRFARFRRVYNECRPHEALAQAYPATWYTPSPRAYPTVLPPLEYPDQWRVVTVYGSGDLRWHGTLIWLSDVLCGERVGLHEVADGYWALHLGPCLLGVLDERRKRVRAASLLATISAGARVLRHASADREP
jgi:transposase InsO family protein